MYFFIFKHLFFNVLIISSDNYFFFNFILKSIMYLMLCHVFAIFFIIFFGDFFKLMFFYI